MIIFEVSDIHPGDFCAIDRFGFPRNMRAKKKIKPNDMFMVLPPDLREFLMHVHLYPDLFLNFTCDALFKSLIGIFFPAGEFPQ